MSRPTHKHKKSGHLIGRTPPLPFLVLCLGKKSSFSVWSFFFVSFPTLLALVRRFGGSQYRFFFFSLPFFPLYFLCFFLRSPFFFSFWYHNRIQFNQSSFKKKTMDGISLYRSIVEGRRKVTRNDKMWCDVTAGNALPPNPSPQFNGSRDKRKEKKINLLDQPITVRFTLPARIHIP